MYTMKESVAVAKEADAKKGVSPTKSDNSILRLRNEPERQLGSLRSVIGNITRNGGTPSVDSIATELGSTSSAQRAPALLALQRTHGNQYVQRVVTGIQAKLKVGQPGDKYEQEADRVADAVMRMPEPGVQRQPEEEKEEELQAKDRPSQTTEVTPNLESRINAIKGVGQPLPVSSRAFFEPRFGYDFSQVQVHTDAEADNLNRTQNARAFTTGQDIFFRQGEYNPCSSSDRKLLAHELTHVVQQMGGARPKLTLGQPGDRYEQEAGQVARAVIHRERRATIEKADEGLVRRQVKEEQGSIQTKAEGLWFQRQAEEEDQKKQVARGAPVGRKDSSNSDRKSVKQSKSTSYILHLQQKIGNQSVQRLLESKAQNDDMIPSMVQLNAPIMMAFWRRRTRGDEPERTGEVESREDTEAMLQREIAHLRPRIPGRYNIMGMAAFDSQFFDRGSDLFNFRGHVMQGWEVNYYFVSMAMAHQGHSWSEAQDIIALWNTIQDIPYVPGEGTMTDEMWFAAQQGFDDEIDRLRSEPAEPLPPGATPFTCFPDDVPITLGDGSETLISTLRPGQYVLAADMTNTIRKCKVTDVHIHLPGQVLILQFIDGRILRVTANHLVYSSGQWVEASELSPGDSVSSLTFDHCGITSLILENVINRPFETETLYDITVDNCHTFFAQGILVHNKI
jgi:hypothetical protein